MKQLTNSAEEDTGVWSRQDRLEAHTVPTAFPQILTSLICHTLGHRHCTDSPRLDQIIRNQAAILILAPVCFIHIIVHVVIW